MRGEVICVSALPKLNIVRTFLSPIAWGGNIWYPSVPKARSKMPLPPNGTNRTQYTSLNIRRFMRAVFAKCFLPYEAFQKTPQWSITIGLKAFQAAYLQGKMNWNGKNEKHSSCFSRDSRIEFESWCKRWFFIHWNSDYTSDCPIKLWVINLW